MRTRDLEVSNSLVPLPALLLIPCVTLNNSLLLTHASVSPSIMCHWEAESPALVRHWERPVWKDQAIYNLPPITLLFARQKTQNKH